MPSKNINIWCIRWVHIHYKALRWYIYAAVGWDNAQIMTLMPKFYQRITQLETWYMRSQPHGLNQEEGVLPSVYNTLISGSRECVHRTAGTSNWLLGTYCPPICARVTCAIVWIVVVYLCVCLYCIVVYTTAEDHRSVVETFGVNISSFAFISWVNVQLGSCMSNHPTNGVFHCFPIKIRSKYRGCGL